MPSTPHNIGRGGKVTGDDQEMEKTSILPPAQCWFLKRIDAYLDDVEQLDLEASLAGIDRGRIHQREARLKALRPSTASRGLYLEEYHRDGSSCHLGVGQGCGD